MAVRSVNIVRPVSACMVLCLPLFFPPDVLPDSARIPSFDYVSPLPGATRVNPGTTIAFRQGAPIAAASLGELRVSALGSKSGVHRVTTKLSDDGVTVVCIPDPAFMQAETVHVHIGGGLRTTTGHVISGLSYTFVTSTREIRKARHAPRPGSSALQSHRAPRQSIGANDRAYPGNATGELPPDFPPIRVLRNNTPTGDPLFLGNFSWGPDSTPQYMMILYRDGSPAFYRKAFAWDFKVQPNGLLTYFDEYAQVFYGLDSAYHMADSFYCGNGYSTNEHELRVLPDGHAYVMSYDAETVGMDTVVPGGHPTALVWGLIIQEIDRDKNVVFEWRSWDHLKITDATQEDLTAWEIDYVHGNSIDIDVNGNIMISSRNIDEVTKISRSTGEIMWRLGGKNNQFTIHDNAGWIDHQHTAYHLPNGNITIHDNGTFRGYSRAVEYAIDETTRVATKVWEYNANQAVLGWAMGSTQRLPNGNTLIGWGSANPIAAEVTPNGTVVYELDMRELEFTYRIFSAPWQTTAFVPQRDTVLFGVCTPDDTARTHVVISNPTTHDVTLTSFPTRSTQFAADTTGPVLLPALGTFVLPLRFSPDSLGSMIDTLEIRSEDSLQGIIRRVILRGMSAVPTLVISAPDLDFGVLAIGDSAVRAVTIHNPSGIPITIDRMIVSGSAFTVNVDAPVVVREDDSLLLSVRFLPLAIQIYEDTLSLHTSAGVYAIPLHGEGKDPLLNIPAVNDPVPSEFLLGQNYPNPFNPSTSITVGLPVASMISVSVYDALGREVAVLVRAALPPGYHRYVWDGASMATGIYICRVTAVPTGADGHTPFMESIKMLLLR